MNLLALLLIAVVPHTGEMVESSGSTMQWSQASVTQCPGPNCPTPQPKTTDKPWLPGRQVPELPTIHPNPSPKPEQPLVTPPTIIPLKPREQ